MFLNGRLGLWVLIVIAGGCDRLSKYWAISKLSLGKSLPCLPSLLQWTLTHNTGAAFSLGADQPGLLLLVSGILFLGILCFVFSQKQLTMLETFGYGLILGGAASNLWDRLFYGAVIDYIDIVAVGFPIFNLADMLIFSGVVLVFSSFWRHRFQEHSSP
ncbi:MAG: signal peptidase II [Cyanobacteria bacterium]|nr:signal peptidase II [Cyanobacteriota bacterium]